VRYDSRMTAQSDRPAPAPLEVVRAYVNTLDLEQGSDALATPAALGAWLSRAGLGEVRPTPDRDDLERALQLREALRALLRANAHGGPAPRAALRTVNEATARAGLSPRLGEHGDSHLAVSATGVAGALGRLLAIVHEASASGRLERLKACSEAGCQWAFYDSSRNHSSRWCQMGVCGNRSKARAFRARRRAG
jgi:predicted RNA-binding Zn ribbon-like protein